MTRWRLRQRPMNGAAHDIAAQSADARWRAADRRQRVFRSRHRRAEGPSALCRSLPASGARRHQALSRQPPVQYLAERPRPLGDQPARALSASPMAAGRSALRLDHEPAEIDLRRPEHRQPRPHRSHRDADARLRNAQAGAERRRPARAAAGADRTTGRNAARALVRRARGDGAWSCPKPQSIRAGLCRRRLRRRAGPALRRRISSPASG